MSRTPLVPGYSLVDRLHRGPAADVWRAVREDGRPVAVKVPAEGPGGADTPREAALMRAVRHEHLLGLVDQVLLDDGRTCLVTDLAEGGTLDDLVAARGGLTVAEVAAVLAPVAEALWALHRQDLVHGDVSPRNILFTDRAVPLLADLGAGGRGHAVTGVFGTEGFVAPELLTGSELSPATDLFSLGAVAVHALTGQGVSALERTDRVLGRCAESVELPDELADVVRSLLAGDPGERLRAIDAARALRAIADPAGVEVGGRSEGRLVTYRVRGSHRRPAPTGPVVGACSGRRRVAVAAAVALGAVVAGAGVAATWGPIGSVAQALHPASTVAVAPASAAASSSGALVPSPTDPSAPSSPPAVPTGSPVPTADAADPAASADAVVRDAGAVLAAVLGRRAAALERAEVAGLAQVDVPGSWARERDEAIVAQLRQRGERQRGLVFDIGSVSVVRSTSTTAVVDAVVSLGAYRYERGGRVFDAAAGAPRRERYELAWVGGRWQIARVSPVTA